MKIALVQLKSPDLAYEPNLGILYIAAVTRKAGYTVNIFDETLNANFFYKLIEYKPDVVGFTAPTLLINKVYATAEKLKKINHRIVTVCGGPHPTALPREVVSQSSIDYVVVREGEYPFVELIHSLKNKKSIENVQNLYYKKKGIIKKNISASFLNGAALDGLPYPAFDLLDMNEVFKNISHGLFAKGKKILPIMTSRGCPNYCAFCCRVMGGTFRRRSLESIRCEIKYMIEHYGIDELFFEDDSISENLSWAKEIFIMLKKLPQKLHIKLANGMRADKADKEFFSMYREAGGYHISFGIESGSERILHLMRKQLDLKKTCENVVAAKKARLSVGGNLIIGYPGEKPEDINTSIRFFKTLKLDTSATVNLVPFPGTGAYKQAKKNNWFTDYACNYTNYRFGILFFKPLVSTPYLSALQLRYYMLKAFLLLYCNINTVKKIVMNRILR